MFERLKSGLNQILDRLEKTELKGKKLDSILVDLKYTLLENDVALMVAEYICNDVKRKVIGLEIGRFEDKEKIVKEALRETLMEILTIGPELDLLEYAARKKKERIPLVILFIGINGTGKTTSIAKVAKFFLDRSFSVVLASSDTYRAGSIEQLEKHAKALGISNVKHRYGADAAAVAFDAINHAKAREINLVLIDTAGRMQTNKNLMNELAKIKRVANPHLTIFVVDALTGNDAVEQAEIFNKLVGFDMVILTKIDADSKGGASLSVVYTTKKPIIFLGTGQKYEDLQSFDAEWFVGRIVN